MGSIIATIGQDRYTTNIVSEREHALLADEPVAKGGTDKGPMPEELLAASLGACTCITLRMYANRKQWPVEQIEATVNVHYHTDNPIPVLSLNIKLTGTLSDDQKQRLLVIAGKCPMHKAITNPLVIETRVV